MFLNLCDYLIHAQPTLYGYLSHAQSMPYFLSTHLIDAQPIWLFSIYMPDACSADMYLRCPVMLSRYVIALSTTLIHIQPILQETPMNDLNNPILLFFSHLVIAR